MFFKKLLFLIFTCAILLSCDSGTEPNSNSVQGKFVTEEGAAIEGALVRVFEIKPLDTLVMRLRRDYKDVGCDISDATEFDHRFYGTPIAEGKTGADGKFSFKNLSGGPYHISVTHPEYSWRYIYRKNGNIGEVRTLPVIEIKGPLAGDITWDREGQDYVVTGNTSVNGGSLTIKSGVRVRLGNQRRLLVQDGNLIMQGEAERPVWVTSDTDSSEAQFSAGVHVPNSEVEVKGGVFRGATSGITCDNRTKGRIYRSCFYNNFDGVTGNQATSNLRIENNIACNNTTSYLLVSSSTTIQSCIAAYNDDSGIKIRQNAKGPILNSFASGNVAGIAVDSDCMINISNSEFMSVGSGLLSSGGNIISMELSISSGKIPVDIKARSSGYPEKHSINIKQTNLYPHNSQYTVSITVKTELTLRHVYFETAATQAEYERMIRVGSNVGATIYTDNIIYTPAHFAGLLR